MYLSYTLAPPKGTDFYKKSCMLKQLLNYFAVKIRLLAVFLFKLQKVQTVGAKQQLGLALIPLLD